MSILGLIALILVVYRLLKYKSRLMQEEDRQSAGAKLERDLNAVGDSVWEWVSGCIVACLGFYVLLGVLWLLAAVVLWMVGK